MLHWDAGQLLFTYRKPDFPLFNVLLSIPSFSASPSSLCYSVCISITQTLNWCLCINECWSIRSRHDAQPCYHAFIVAAGNCKGVADCVCASRGGRPTHTQHAFYLHRCVCVCLTLMATTSFFQHHCRCFIRAIHHCWRERNISIRKLFSFSVIRVPHAALTLRWPARV